MRREIYIDYRLDLDRVVEGDFTSIDAVLISEKLDLAGVDGDVAEQDGAIGCASNAKVGIRLDVARKDGLYGQGVLRDYSNVQLKTLKVLAGGGGNRCRGGDEQCAHICRGIERSPVERNGP